MLKYFYIESDASVSKRKSLDRLYDKINLHMVSNHIYDENIISMQLETKVTTRLVSPITGIKETSYVVCATVTYSYDIMKEAKINTTDIPKEKISWWKKLIGFFKRKKNREEH